MNAAELERNDCFSLPFIKECCVVIEENIDTKLSDGISYQIQYGTNDANKESSEGGVHILFFKKTVVLRRWESIAGNLVLTTGLKT